MTHTHMYKTAKKFINSGPSSDRNYCTLKIYVVIISITNNGTAPHPAAAKAFFNVFTAAVTWPVAANVL